VPGILTALDREFGLHDSYARRRPTRRPALRSGNRNPRRSRRTDVGGEICSPRNFGSASVAKEYAQAESPSLAAIEHDPQRFILTHQRVFQKAFCEYPLTSILSPQAARGGEALDSGF